MACRNHVSSVLPLYIILFLFMFCSLFLTARACAITHDTAHPGTHTPARHVQIANSGGCGIWLLLLFTGLSFFAALFLIKLTSK